MGVNLYLLPKLMTNHICTDLRGKRCFARLPLSPSSCLPPALLTKVSLPLTFWGGCEVFHGLQGKRHTAQDREGSSKVSDVMYFPEVMNFKL